MPSSACKKKKHLTIPAQRVEKQRDQTLNRLGNRDLSFRRDGGDRLAPPEEATVEQHADELFRVERIATGALQQDRTRIHWQCRLGRQGVDELRGLRLCQRRKREHRRVALAAPPVGIALVER